MVAIGAEREPLKSAHPNPTAPMQLLSDDAPVHEEKANIPEMMASTKKIPNDQMI